MGCRPAPAAKQALDELTRLHPGRNRASDGICASQQHTSQNPTSDHEPRSEPPDKGYAHAFDATHDPAKGVNAGELADLLIRRRDSRVRYIIFSFAICWSIARKNRNGKTYQAWEWQPYHGKNPHIKHVHVSILAGHGRDTRPWWTTAPATPTPPSEEEDEMAAPVLVQKEGDGEVYELIGPRDGALGVWRLVPVPNGRVAGLKGYDLGTVQKLKPTDEVWELLK